MAKRIKNSEKIVNRSIGFHLRQLQFFEKYPEFKPDLYCREAIEDQIRLIDREFLSEEEIARGDQ